MIKLTKVELDTLGLDKTGIRFINAFKILEVYIFDGKTLIVLENKDGFFVKESLEDVLQQINKVLIGGNNE